MSEQVGCIVDEWTEEREAGALGFRLVMTEEGDSWLDVRIQYNEDDDGETGAWSEWEEEDIYGSGGDVIARLPETLKVVRAEERSRVRRELLAWYRGSEADGAPDFIAALDRICPAAQETTSPSTTSS